MKPRILSGIQPTGVLHIGNYIGAIRQWVELQRDHDCLFMLADLHALTVPENITAAALRDGCRRTAALYIACGVDADAAIFIQSHVREHSELAWILNCMTPVGWLERMTQFKSKSERAATIGMGLFDYPVLQAADILLYDTDVVPVGEDQKQHIELTRDIAQRFNSLYGGEILKAPKPVLPQEGARIMALNEPTTKMSKSDPNANHAVFLLDTPEQIRAKLARAVTDSKTAFDPEAMAPGVANLVTIIKTMGGSQLVDGLVGQGYGALKRTAAEVIVETLAPIQRRYAELLNAPDELEAILARGAKRACALAAPKLRQVQQAVGLGS